MTDMEDIRARLIGRFQDLPDMEANALDFERAIYLIGWTEDHPEATRSEYQAVMRRVKTARIEWPPVFILPDPFEAIEPPDEEEG